MITNNETGELRASMSVVESSIIHIFIVGLFDITLNNIIHTKEAIDLPT